jgi:uncharacterized membrane protein
MADKTRTRGTALAQLAVSIGIGIVAAVVAGVWGPLWLTPIVGWDAAMVAYLIWTWSSIGHLDADDTAGHAKKEDPTRRGSDILLLLANLASLGAVVVVIVNASQISGVARVMQTILGVVSIVISWIVVHTTYTLRYANLYHNGDPGGVDFNDAAQPRYGDFAYLAFTIGMTFQVSDTSLTSSAMRRAALRHALQSYIYGTVIIAAAINIVAGLTK